MTDIKYKGVFFGETNQGKVRTNNEDTYICQHIWDKKHILCAAIDGLGGYEGGEVAAEIARVTIIKHLEDFASKKLGDLLKAAIIDANNEIISQHKTRPKVSQMGCVASVGIIDLSQGIVTIAHVGDSRIYQFVNGELKKLTHDHSLVGYREEVGEMSEEDAMNHPKRNVIDKFLGEQYLNFDSTNYVEISVWPILGDTQYLFCSDGLTDLVKSATISEILSLELSVKDKVKRLIKSANDAGGKDNITVVIADVSTITTTDIQSIPGSEIQPEKPAETRKKRSSSSRPLMYGVAGLILGIVASCVYNSCSGGEKNSNSQANIIKLKSQNDKLNTQVKSLEDSLAKYRQANGNVEIVDNSVSSESASKPSQATETTE